ncbi:hypothetical protein Sgleb_43240 [Streptomyces glebosus]|uniref:DUF4190 domain-containing protein n=1 Tax=Streptomyces glebosus TaxID=249580 RepID=A0A640SXY3_9ACTN|nr:hypothetical protein Sgleb_43240 [Streptomyces glebosus]GHG63946.1 hypothetical protein GCM10010513_31600 [Streptomyces glebosus]
MTTLSEAIRTTTPAKPTKPARTTKPAQAVKPTQAAADATQTAKSAQTADPAQATDPAQSADLATSRLRRHADGMAVASFILGLLGTLVLNLLLGPCALVLGTLALARGTTRRGRALLGLTLGATDLLILALLVTTDGTVSWHIGG